MAVIEVIATNSSDLVIHGFFKTVQCSFVIAREAHAILEAVI